MIRIDRTVLRLARPEALERLARALGVWLPPIPQTAFRLDGWRRAAARTIARVTCPEPSC